MRNLVERESVIGIALVMGWTVRGSNTDGSDIFDTCLHRPRGLPLPLYNG